MDGRGRGCVAGYAGGLGAEKTKGWGRARIIWAKMDTEPKRNTPVMKPWAAIEVISSGGATSPLWLCGAGILVCICVVVSTGEQQSGLGKELRWMVVLMEAKFGETINKVKTQEDVCFRHQWAI